MWINVETYDVLQTVVLTPLLTRQSLKKKQKGGIFHGLWVREVLFLIEKLEALQISGWLIAPKPKCF